ncbi:MAG: hypothetical protein IJA72_00820 [Clostridia bacterium]|nr:hypothetical protein [Clostridia bacterium]
MQLYLYSSQDLIVENNGFINIEANNIYRLNMVNEEILRIYNIYNSGVIVLNMQTINKRLHNNIIFHEINNDVVICEIKPFVCELGREYNIQNATIKIINSNNASHIFFNNTYYGCINGRVENIEFDKFIKNGKEHGLVKMKGDEKNILVFCEDEIKYCGRYYDYEVLKDCCNIYTYIPNIFNVGQLICIQFDNALLYKQVKDRGEEFKNLNDDFYMIYFIEAIKCGRYKYAYSMLSHELKSEINIDTLQKYFGVFDRYIYLSNEDVFVMINNNKISGIYNIKIKNKLINNIY